MERRQGFLQIVLLLFFISVLANCQNISYNELATRGFPTRSCAFVEVSEVLSSPRIKKQRQMCLPDYPHLAYKQFTQRYKQQTDGCGLYNQVSEYLSYGAATVGCGVGLDLVTKAAIIKAQWDRIEHCCILHDCCYDTCGVTRYACDLLFEDCLRNVDWCKGAAYLMSQAVKIYGNVPYYNAQESKCYVEIISGPCVV